jgi:hypothetical protein
MKSITASFLLLFLLSPFISGQMGSRQTFFEFQFGAGPTFLMTDIGSMGMGGNIEVTGKYRLHPHIALKASLGGGLGLGSGTAADDGSMSIDYYTILAELTGQIEVYLLKEGRGQGRGGRMGYKPRVRPYLYAGGGPLFFFPNHTHEDAEELADFNPYTVILVGGAGFLYRVNADFFWGFQCGARITTTDFLEGYETATSSSNDNYISAQVLLVHRF